MPNFTSLSFLVKAVGGLGWLWGGITCFHLKTSVESEHLDDRLMHPHWESTRDASSTRPYCNIHIPEDAIREIVVAWVKTQGKCWRKKFAKKMEVIFLVVGLDSIRGCVRSSVRWKIARSRQKTVLMENCDEQHESKLSVSIVNLLVDKRWDAVVLW